MTNDESATASRSDEDQVKHLKELGERNKVNLQDCRDFSLPCRVNLESGSNKYVIIQAKSTSKKNKGKLLFVRSASPSSCGGHYHADVARSLVEELSMNGYFATVIGGGRIDFDKEIGHAHIYGFSYGFGKGNHTLVAEIIEENTDIVTTINDADGIY